MRQAIHSAAEPGSKRATTDVTDNTDKSKQKGALPFLLSVSSVLSVVKFKIFAPCKDFISSLGFSPPFPEHDMGAVTQPGLAQPNGLAGVEAAPRKPMTVPEFMAAKTRGARLTHARCAADDLVAARRR